MASRSCCTTGACRVVGGTWTTLRSPTAVYVIDAKAWQGRSRRPRRCSVGRSLQVAVVRAALGEDHGGVAVRGVLCFTRAELPLVRTLTIRSHLLLYRKALAKRINR